MACFTYGLRPPNDGLTPTDDDAHMKIRPLRLLIATVAVLAVTAPATAVAATSGLTSEKGIVQSVDATHIELRALDGSVVSFAVAARTRVKVNGVSARLTDIKPGYVATVTHNGDRPAVLIRAFGKAPPITSRGVVTSLSKGEITLSTGTGTVTIELRPSTSLPFPRRPGHPASGRARSARCRQVPGRQPREVRQRGQARPEVTSTATRAGGTILLVEDEEDIATLVRTYLEREGFSVTWVDRGADAYLALEQADFRLAILDLQLPDADGLDLCRAIRDTSSLPVVIVTARDEEIDRILGLELGADDYVTKPFSPRELVARVKAVLRRADPEETNGAIVAGDIELDPESRTVSVSGQTIELTSREFDLLAYLLAHPGTVMSRERLLERVWGLAFPGGTRTVDVHVAQLRRKLDRPDLIRTVRGSGYKCAA